MNLAASSSGRVRMIGSWWILSINAVSQMDCVFGPMRAIIEQNARNSRWDFVVRSKKSEKLNARVRSDA
jgi:hypothetical protein